MQVIYRKLNNYNHIATILTLIKTHTSEYHAEMKIVILSLQKKKVIINAHAGLHVLLTQ